jgi:hypothetical protein
MFALSILLPSADAQDRARRTARHADDGPLHVADLAPPFKLKSLDGNADADLSELRLSNPVVLIFGSYT